MPVDSVQMQLIRRYARILRAQQTSVRGSRIGANKRRATRDAAQTVSGAAGTAAQRALSAVEQPQSPAT